MHAHELLSYFKYSHLPQALQNVSKPFSDLAQKLVDGTEESLMRTEAIKKLLEAKDCAVRANLNVKG